MGADDAMKDGEVYPGFSPAAYGAPVAHMPAVPSAVLPNASHVAPASFRPLSTGEVLDRTFALYRQRFWLFAGIGLLPAGVLLLSSAVRLLFVTATGRTGLAQVGGIKPQQVGEVFGSLMALQLYLLPAGLLFLVAYGVAHAAAVDAVNRIGQGMPVSVGGVYGAVRGRWLRWVGIVLRQFWCITWPMLPGVVLLVGATVLLASLGSKGSVVLASSIAVLSVALIIAGVVYGVINFIHATLAIAAGVSEDLGVNAAMRRSRMLSAGRKGRLLLAWLLVYALQMVVTAVQLPLLFAAMSLRGGAFVAVQAVVMLVQFVAVALVTPVSSVAFTLFYIDERVRREGFDIELLMRRTLPQPVAYSPEM